MDVIGIANFIEDLDGIYLPERIYSYLNLEVPGTIVKFQLINDPIPKGIRVTLKPITSDLLEIDDPKSYLENHLRFNYSALSKDSIISLPLSEGKELKITIIDTSPSERINITECDLEIEFQEPDDYENYMAIKKSIEDEKNRKKKELEAIEEANKLRDYSKNYNFGKLVMIKQPNHNQNIDPKKEKTNNNNFIPFSGSGNCLNGKLP
jgi:hypothetical protein